ncbi:MAG: glycosyltransferase family 4 protein [Candidatus Latescibacterota bacterium]|nr:MAG: glycosyltransferase family 4 protein [Candidatus Latescibacterota bacterium]
MNILFCQPTLEYTGSEMSLLLIVRMLRARGGHRLSLLVGKDGPMRSRFEEVADDIEAVDAPKLKRNVSVVPGYLRSFFTMFEAIRRLKRRQPIDVVYVNTLMFPQAVVGARLNGLKCVVHVREIESRYPRVFYQSYLALATLLAARVVCACKYIIGQKRILFPGKLGAKARVVFNASSFDNPPIRRSIESRFRILTVSAPGRLKGTWDLLPFAHMLTKKLGSRPFDLEIVGRVHDDDLFKQVTVKLRDAGLDDRVKFCGEQDDMAPYYTQAHVLLHTSHADTFPRVLVEATSFSLPAITTDTGGCPEAVVDGKTGFVVPVGNTEAMAECAARLATDSVLYDKMSAAAYDRYKACYTVDHMIGGVLSVLDEVGRAA